MRRARTSPQGFLLWGTQKDVSRVLPRWLLHLKCAIANLMKCCHYGSKRLWCLAAPRHLQWHLQCIEARRARRETEEIERAKLVGWLSPFPRSLCVPDAVGLPQARRGEGWTLCCASLHPAAWTGAPLQAGTQQSSFSCLPALPPPRRQRITQKKPTVLRIWTSVDRHYWTTHVWTLKNPDVSEQGSWPVMDVDLCKLAMAMQPHSAQVAACFSGPFELGPRFQEISLVAWTKGRQPETKHQRTRRTQKGSWRMDTVCTSVL